MIVSFAWPSNPWRTGGVVALYEFANGLARLGNEVHFIHAPKWPNRIEHIDELAWFEFDPGVSHHIVDDVQDPSLPDGDVVFLDFAPARLGLPCLMVQGARMVGEEVEAKAFRFPAPKVCIASWLLDVGRHYGAPDEQLWHVPMGLDHERFRPRTPAEERTYDVAMLHHPHPSKGWRPGLQALEAAEAEVPGLRALVFGPARPPEALPDWIDFVEFPDQEHLATGVYDASRVFVQPSLFEGFGFTAVEAMACGAALVSTDNGGSRDYAIDGKTALVVSPGDVGSMAQAIVRLVTDAATRSRLAEAGVELTRGFDWDIGARRLAELLERYVADPARYQQPPGPAPTERWS